MRVVLDTNVLVSALWNVHGAPAQVLDLVRQGFLSLCADGRIHGEYEEVLSRPDFPFDPGDVATLMRFLRESSEFVAARPLTHRLPDPEDEPFLEVAAQGRVDALVTGNMRHFPKNCRAGVPVMTPDEVIALIRRKGSGTVAE
ncbi:MAG: putative toxin-antitoxin system toxin component, PIN family [Spirochaetes bacterium]|nr:putative toxin-antitoxin system toxin component, PIN family [Spirochaetota bacterium]